MVNMFYKYHSYKVIDDVIKTFPKVDLSRVYYIGCGHLLPSYELLLDYLISFGLLPRNISLIGKCYSASRITIRNLRQKGIFVSPYSIKYDSSKSYNQEYIEYTYSFLREIVKNIDLNIFDKVVIADDGGILHIAASDLLHESSNIVGIEQTSKGVRNLLGINIDYPIINIARSDVKLCYESPLVAKSVVDSLRLWLEGNKFVGKIQNALIVGIGSIGLNIADMLKNSYRIIKYDRLEHKSETTIEQLRECAGDIDLVIGCSGENILPLLEMTGIIRSNVILASASSLDIEFNEFPRPIDSDCHGDICNNNIFLINNGFPINFHGGNDDNIPLGHFQITIALMISAIVQCLSQKIEKKLMPVLWDYQQTIVDSYLNLFKYDSAFQTPLFSTNGAEYAF